MATISTTARPAYVYDAVGDQWVPIAWRVLPAGVGSAPALTFTGDSNTGLWSPAADTVAFSTGGSERLRIDSAGNVNIGAVSGAPRIDLTIQQNARTVSVPTIRLIDTDSAAVSNTNGALEFYASDGSSPAGSSVRVALQSVANANGGASDFRLLTNDGTLTERMRITSAGNVGIGTSSPATILHVESNTTAAPLFQTASDTVGNTSLLIFRRSRGTNASPTAVSSGDPVGIIGMRGYNGSAFPSGNRGSITFAADEAWTTTANGSRISLSTVANGATTETERMRIDNAGNVGIGTSSPEYPLHVKAADSSTSVLLVRGINASTSLLSQRANGTSASPTVVASGDEIGRVSFGGYDGSAYRTAATIVAAVDGTPGASDMPGRLSFNTTADGGTAQNERLRIDNAGLITGTGTSLGAWTAYTPTLGGTGWAIGDGTLTGVYCQIGKVIHFRARFIAGSTTSFGSGSPVIGIVTAASDVGTSLNSVAVATVYDTSAGTFYATVPVYASTTGVSIGALGTGGLRGTMNSTTPMTWAANDEIRLSGTYQAA